MPVPIWAGHYIGLPFREHGRDRAGLDCWGLVRLVMAEQFGLALPSFAQNYKSTMDLKPIGRLVAAETQKWSQLSSGEEDAGDVVILRVRGVPLHVGLVLGDRHMLHIERGINSAIESYARPHWAERVFGFYRYNPFLQEEGASYGLTFE
ncbi:MAG: NlpC/P60 family protein [Alphaproteobacteria bacterium]|nr:NlpC/P60 family protein [Alphaproteobacteria bacterium]